MFQDSRMLSQTATPSLPSLTAAGLMEDIGGSPQGTTHGLEAGWVSTNKTTPTIDRVANDSFKGAERRSTRAITFPRPASPELGFIVHLIAASLAERAKSGHPTFFTGRRSKTNSDVIATATPPLGNPSSRGDGLFVARSVARRGASNYRCRD
jgi:hypothetical protein